MSLALSHKKEPSTAKVRFPDRPKIHLENNDYRKAVHIWNTWLHKMMKTKQFSYTTMKSNNSFFLEKFVNDIEKQDFGSKKVGKIIINLDYFFLINFNWIQFSFTLYLYTTFYWRNDFYWVSMTKKLFYSNQNISCITVFALTRRFRATLGRPSTKPIAGLVVARCCLSTLGYLSAYEGNANPGTLNKNLGWSWISW